MNWYKMSQNLSVCFYVDLDETMVHTTFDINRIGPLHPNELEMDQEELLSKRGYQIVFDSGSRKYWSKLRPGTQAFLSELKTMGKVFLCTAATQSYADSALNFFCINGYFDAKYYRQDVAFTTTKNLCDKFFLIDDHDFDSQFIFDKMMFLGSGMGGGYMPADHKEYDLYKKKLEQYANDYSPKLIKVAPYNGQDNDNEFSNAIAKIRSILT